MLSITHCIIVFTFSDANFPKKTWQIEINFMVPSSAVNTNIQRLIKETKIMVCSSSYVFINNPILDILKFELNKLGVLS
jgi:hypothetical protein